MFIFMYACVMVCIADVWSGRSKISNPFCVMDYRVIGKAMFIQVCAPNWSTWIDTQKSSQNIVWYDNNRLKDSCLLRTFLISHLINFTIVCNSYKTTELFLKWRSRSNVNKNIILLTHLHVILAQSVKRPVSTKSRNHWTYVEYTFGALR